jgi:dTDP-4-dehydrorhamnose reductase
MKILILGGSGMLGHKLVQTWRNSFEIAATFRRFDNKFISAGIFDGVKIYENIVAEEFNSVLNVIKEFQPEVVINCIGIIKQLKDAKNAIPSISINALFPHRLADVCLSIGARLICISTDCVFSGKKGNYKEDDFADANDLYGRTKFLGEVSTNNSLTLRSSIIGREIGTAHSLVDWFLSNQGKKIKGYTKAIYSGFPTVIFADILADLIINHKSLNGIWQVSSDPISKYRLLTLIRDEYGIDIEIEPSEEVIIDRSLNSEKFRSVTGFVPKTWEHMVKEMVADF